MLVVPAMSDYFGRKNIFCATMIVSIIAQYGLINSSSIETSTMFMIMLGATWPGKRVTGLNFILEFFPEVDKKNYITVFTMIDYPSILIISMYYQFVNVNWYG